MPHRLAPGPIVRGMLFAATVIFGLAGFVVRDDPRWFMAAGLTGIVAIMWDVIWDHMARPIGGFAGRLLTEGAVEASAMRPSRAETVSFLEALLVRDVPRDAGVRATLQLEELYRVGEKDPERARELLERAMERWPGDPRLETRRRVIIPAPGPGSSVGRARD